MAYLNDVKLVSYLAVQPEIALDKAGKAYCNFSVRLQYKTPAEDCISFYINVTAFKDDAELLVRKCNVGDLVMVDGYLWVQEWWDKEKKESVQKIVVISRKTSLLHKASKRQQEKMEEAMRLDADSFDPVPYADGANHIISATNNANTKLANEYSNRLNYPQPTADGGWNIPVGREMNERTRLWMKENNVELENPMDKVPDDMKEDAKIAERLVPDSCKPVRIKNGLACQLPSGHYISWENYAEMVENQTNFLRTLPVEKIKVILYIAERYFGVSLNENAITGAIITETPNVMENAEVPSNGWELAPNGEWRKRGENPGGS